MSVKTESTVEANSTCVPFEQCGVKRCGDKVRLRFSDYKKARTPSFDYKALETAQISVLSIVQPALSHNIRYSLLVKGPFAGQDYAHVNVHNKFVFYDVLADDDEVMFALDDSSMWKINTRSCGAVDIARDSVAVVQECLQKDPEDEGESIYTLRLSVQGSPVGECFWVFRREVHYIKRCVEMITMPPPLQT